MAVAIHVLIAELCDQSWDSGLTVQKSQGPPHWNAVVKMPSSGASMQ